MVWVTTKTPYSAADASAAKTSCTVLYSGPGTLVVNDGSTSVSVVRVATVASAAPLPSALNSAMPCLFDATSSDRPRMPLHVIITAAKTVSRARLDAPALPADMSVTIRPTSMIVTATASVSDPNGSPTLCAMTSA